MKDEMMDDDIDNVGIMQGFLNQMEEEEDDLEEQEGSEESSAARVLNRRPDSPEILMNNLRGDMRSVDARREELADLVGFQAAAETPDTVLAMLQPVLAQGAGIGALPQSGPMAQGPQPPMPPPSGGEMGGMPPGAPPLPPGGPMPPSGGDMAALLAASPPPGGGMAPGAAPAPEMIGPDGQPIPPEGMPPIQMRKGGLVQRFKNGSTPEGVTQDDEEDLPDGGTSAAQLLYSPELVDFAQLQAARTMAQRGTPVPTLKEAMEARLPEYERLLAPDTKTAQANLLFDVAGAALNFAANRGPRGEVLRGSPMARLAGAFSNLPAAVQKRVSDIEDTKRQLRLLALQAGEKDRDEIQNLNAKLATEQRSILNTVLTADARSRAAQMRAGVGAATGTRSEWEMNTFNTPGLMERFAAGQSTPQENNLLASAITSYTEPRYEAVLEPGTGRPTGEYRTLPGKRLPGFVVEAQRMRNSGGAPAGTTVTLPREAPAGTTVAGRENVPVETPAPLLSEGGREPTTAGTARPVDRPIDEPNYLPREEAMASPVSLWRDRSKIAGPFASVYAGVSQVPGLGDPMRDITLARSQANLVAEEVVEAFLKSAQNSVTEQRMLQGVLQLKPALLKDPEAYGTQLIALSTMIDQAIAENKEKANVAPGAAGTMLSDKQIVGAREKLMVLEKLRKNLGLPPAVYTREDVAKLPAGTEFLWYGTVPRKAGVQ